MPNSLKVLASIILLVAVALTHHSSSSFAQQELQSEVIKSYASTIQVNIDRSLTVTETIEVQATGDQIKRGIFRDIPTVINTDYGREIKPITILSVKKDGVAEPYFTESISDGLRLYIGQSDVFLTVPQTYTYELTYRADDQIRLFYDHDEVYWNVTGNFWGLPITKSAAKVVLPFAVNADQLKTVSYVGPVKSTQNSANPSITTDNTSNTTTIEFQHAQELLPAEGLTIAVGFPKGNVIEPTKLEQNTRMYFELIQLISALLVFLIAGSLFYYLWKKYGTDKGGLPSIPVNFGPPEHTTPLEVRAIDKLGAKDSVYLSLVILQLAIKGYIKLVEHPKNTYNAVRTLKDTSDLEGVDLKLFNLLFPNQVLPTYSAEAAIEQLTAKKGFFDQLGSLFVAEDAPEGVFKFVRSNRTQVLALQAAVDTELGRLKKKYVISNANLVGLLMLIDVCAVFVYFAFLFALSVLLFGPNLAYFYTAISPNNLNLIAYFVLCMLFGFSVITAGYMPRRTKLARELQDKIEGFKIFLKSQEYYLQGLSDAIPDRFNMYEKYLPFAIALNLEPIWSSKFKKEIAEMAKLNDNGQVTSWYIGRDLSNGFNFSSSSFTASISSSMQSTSSGSGSSGFSSGGSSGGGGGGGGGGGW